MATIESLQAQVIALQASEAKLTAEVDLLQGHIEEYKGELEDALAGSAPLTMYSNDFKDWENHPFLRDKVVLNQDGYLETCADNGRRRIQQQEKYNALKEENEKLKADNEKLFQFIIQVNGTEEHVEKMIVERMSKEFIDGNQDWWDQMELFQED
tara:strand:+ start:289 stop:753 length:465 start_codon:yes stop_codon:yes gene_type:complete